MSIIIHNESDFEKMKKAGKLAALLLNKIETIIRPGITTKALDNFAENFIKKHGAISACYGYKNKLGKPFPAYICTSVNHVICHGIPGEQILQEGDIIGVDVTLIIDGWHGDTCKTFPVGKISNEAEQLIFVAKDALAVGIAAAKGFIGNIGAAISDLMKTKYCNKYSITEDYCGHGIGQKFHAEPQVPHNLTREAGPEIKSGMFFTIEPMINIGKKETRLLNDGWTVITKDYSLSAQFEHSIGIYNEDVIIFTE